MRKIDLFKSALVAAAVCVSFGASAQSDIVQNAMTVGDLIRAENASLTKKPVNESEVVTARTAAANRTRTADVTVRSIMGLGTDLRASLVIDGIPYSRVKAGDPAGQCVVVRIENKCVNLAPAKKGGNQNACPTSCWTGVFADPVPQQPAPGGMPTAGVAPLPPGMPVPSQQAIQRQ